MEKNKQNIDNNIGKKYGRWTILDEAEPTYVGKDHAKRKMYLCECECGTIRSVYWGGLRTGKSQSCGCARVETLHPVLLVRNTTHGHSDTRLYNIWSKMKERCNNPNAIRYKNYGGRGIKVCDEWLHNFQAFWDWAINNGYAEDLTIDRVNNDLGYSPDNCRWVDSVAQANNCSTNHFITFNGEVHTITEWSRILNISNSVISARIRNGWDVEKALTTPVRKMKKSNEWNHKQNNIKQ